jgi:hypothetical protein
MHKKLTLQRQTLRNLSDRFLGRAAGGKPNLSGATCEECPGTIDCEPGGGAPTGRCDLVPTIAINGC